MGWPFTTGSSGPHGGWVVALGLLVAGGVFYGQSQPPKVGQVEQHCE